MNDLVVSAIVFACIFGGALLGYLLRASLPKGDLSAETRDAVKVATGTIATMTAVVLGLLLAAAKGFYDNQSHEVTEMSARIVLLDRMLAHYGPEAKGARDALRDSAVRLLDKMWMRPGAVSTQVEPAMAGEVVYDKIQELSPQNELQRSLHDRALNLAVEIGQIRWLMFEQASLPISKTMLAVVIFCLTITFTGFSLHAAPNPTVIVTLVLCALAVSSTLFLILEMYQPLQGVVRISSDPLRNAIAHLGQ
jgi:hypothetical protein